MRTRSLAKISLGCSLRWMAVSFIAAAFTVGMQLNAAFGQTAPVRLLIDHVNILDGHGGPAVKGRVLIMDQRIVQVLPDSGPVPAATTIVDGKGGYLVPGFIDMHA